MDATTQKRSLGTRIKAHYTEGFPVRGSYPAGVKGLFAYGRALVQDMPVGLERLIRLQPVVALVSSLLCIFLMRSGFEYIPFSLGFIAIAFAFIAVRLYLLADKADSAVGKITDFVVQYAVSDILIFVLPFYFESTSLLSRNVLFAILLLLMTVVANWDELYERWILRYAVALTLFSGLTFFVTLNFIFPVLFGLRNIHSLFLSAGLSAVLVLLVNHPARWFRRSWRNGAGVALGLVLLLGTVWFGRSFIPPAPLKLSEHTACVDVKNRVPVQPFTEMMDGSHPQAYYFTAIFAPLGLHEGIRHVWKHEGKEVSNIDLREIRGGREQGFRTWSRHTLREGPGEYEIEVWTAGGQLVGEGRFVVTPKEEELEGK